MTCPACGSATVPGARFCYSCGTVLGDPSTTLDPGTERRVVTVLFGDLSDFTSWAEDLDPERVGVVTDRVLASLASIVSEYGGHVDKLVGDGLMAVFGAPTTHEDDAERAVRAAARMQSVVRRLVAQESGGGRQLGLRVGLNTGEVVAGMQASLSYTVVGDTVNTASRLSDAARVGEVLAGRDTALSTMATASWRSLPPLRLKGKRSPVEAFELVRLRPPGATRLGLADEVALLGRETEIGFLVGRLLDATDSAQAHTVLVSGEAGVGKTRLGRELAHFAGELPAARILWGRTAPYGEGRELAAVAEMVRTACGIEDGDDVATARSRVARVVARLEHPAYAGPVPPGMGEHLRLLLGLEDLRVDGPRETAAPGTPAGGDHVRQAVAALFTSLAAEGPLLLILDDLHWATPTMIDGILQVARHTRGRVLLLCLGRLGMLDIRDRQGWWEELPSFELLPLGPLEPVASDRLLRAYLGNDGLEEPVRTALLERASGNPFFLAELLHLLVDRGVLMRKGDRWELDGPWPDEVLPAGVQAVLAARIDDLDPVAKGVLRNAAVVGDRFGVEAVSYVGRVCGPETPSGVGAAVAVLLERGLVDVEASGGYRFSHTLVRDVAYAGLAKVARARRHAAVARWSTETELLHGSDADVLTASHGERAVRLAAEMNLPVDDPSWQARDVAYAALVRLGQGALHRSEDGPAEQFLARAIGLPHPGGELQTGADVPAHVAHARALAALSRFDEAEAELSPVLGDAGGPSHASALLVLGDLRKVRGDAPGSRAALEQALEEAEAQGADALQAQALRAIGLLDYFEGRLRAAEQRFGQARLLAERVGDERGSGWALQHLAWSATTRGDYELADDALESAAEIFAAAEDTGGLAWVAGTEGFVRLLQGRFTEARELAGSLLPLGEAGSERWGVAALLTIDALAAAELGAVDEAADGAARAQVRFADAGDVWGQALAAIAGGIAARGEGRAAEAAERLASAADFAQQSGHPLLVLLAVTARGYACLDLGDVATAALAAARAREVLGRLDLEPQAALGSRVLIAEVHRREGRPEAALDEVEQALAAVGDAPGLFFPRRTALACLSGTLLELGRIDDAIDTARTAVATPAEDVRSSVLAQRALGLALLAEGDGTGGRAALEQALDVARSTGQRSELALTEQLLNELR